MSWIGRGREGGGKFGERVRLTRKRRPLLFLVIRILVLLGIQRRDDGKYCISLTRQEQGERCLTIFFSAWGWVRFVQGTRGTCLRSEQAWWGAGWSVQAKGLAHWRLSVFISCVIVGVHGQTRTPYTLSAPPPPPPACRVR